MTVWFYVVVLRDWWLALSRADFAEVVAAEIRRGTPTRMRV